MCAKKVTKPQGEVETTGHSWDGIEEFNNPLPRWWVWILYATIIWAIWYSIAYPGLAADPRGNPGVPCAGPAQGCRG